MKILDKFIIKSFIAPFAVAFGIALFVLVMQFMWVYIDDLMGKGLGIFELTELIFYLSMTFVPWALPIGILISTVMVLGNLAERYELSSMKSAGISLIRTIFPLLIITTLITIFSIITSDKIIPWANLKFHSRFYDIRKSKPTLTLMEGVFNDEFMDFTLRIGKKGRDGKSLENVMIYGNKNANSNLINQTIAKNGEMYNTEDKRFIVMNLFNGTQYQENSSGNKIYPFIRIGFKSWQKVFDLSQFERQKTDENLFEKHQKMQSIAQSNQTADSILAMKRVYSAEMISTIRSSFTPFKIKSTPIQTTDRTNTAFNNLDTLSITPQPKAQPTPAESTATGSVKDTIPRRIPRDFYAYLDTIPPYEKAKFQSRAKEHAQSVLSTAQNAVRQLDNTDEAAGKYIYEVHLKFTFAFICMVFLFIGAPMGAIIQKGGFGMPILVAIVFFMVFVVLNIICKNLKDSGDLSAWLAAWTPVFTLIPVALVLTWRAVNDYKMLTFDVPTLLKKLNPRYWRFRKSKQKVVLKS